ncbi:MAG: hypothetical protein ACPGU5_07460 [Lishizhenia sp.]
MAVVFGSLLFLCLSCEFGSEKEVVTIEGNSLNTSELNELLKAYNKDTLSLLDRKETALFWAQTKQKEVYLKQHSPESLIKINKQLLDFESSLYDMYIENEIIKKQLDSAISEAEILAFYNKNREAYAQKNFIVKALYLKVSNNTENLEKIEKAYLLKNDKDIEELKKFANLYASNFYYEENKWIFFEDLVREIPFDIDKNKLIVGKSAYSTKDNKYTYFLNVLDYKIKTAKAPIKVEKERIKERILAKRIKELRKSVPEEIKTLIENNYEVKYNLD